MSSKELGILGERTALKFLKNKDYKILDKNYSPKWARLKLGEIDIIAQKDKIINFVEVKTLINNYGRPSSVIDPEQKVNFQKQRKLIKTAQSWLMEKKIPLDIKWQIDIISIRIDLNLNRAKIQHFKNAVA